MKASPKTSSTLFEQLAAEISSQIETGILQPGERLPSVRRMSEQKSVSIATVLEAYHLLEDEGCIEARPQSGYFITSFCNSAASAVQPEMSTLPFDPENVRVDDLVLQLMHDAANPNLLQLGAALPAPDMLPTARIYSLLAQIARSNSVPAHIYGEPEGLYELRSLIARRYHQIGLPISPDEVVITSGGAEAISLALKVVCKPGDVVVTESPTYFGLLLLLNSLGLKVLEIPTDCRVGISLEALQFALENHPVRAAISVSNFHNPLGSCMPEERKQAMVDLLARFEVPLIEDDVYGELAFNTQRPGVAKTYDHQDQVLLVSSFSKDISPSFRIGWIVPGRYHDVVVKTKMFTTVSTPVILQTVVARYLESGGYDRHLRKIRRAYAQKIEHMTRVVLRTFPEGTRVCSPQGGYVLWVQLPEQVDSIDLYRQALTLGATIAPGYMFSTTRRYRNFIRLNAAFMSFAAERVLEQLGNAAKKLASA